MRLKNFIKAGSVCISCMVSSHACIDSKDDKKQEKALYNEIALKRFIISTPNVSEKNALIYIDSTLNTTSRDSVAFRRTVIYLERSLSDPNSGYTNENLYIQVLKEKIKSAWYDRIEKAALRARLYLCMQNRKGKAANDFLYMTPKGYRKRMYGLRADLTILFFYNPECEACKNMKEAIAGSSLISNSLVSGELKILAVYTEKDIKLWQKHLSEMPENWIQGRDENDYLYNNNIYDLKAIPTIYLLDKNKKVLLKDCMFLSEIEQTIAFHTPSSTYLKLSR
jgi:hypothetical protein